MYYSALLVLTARIKTGGSKRDMAQRQYPAQKLVSRLLCLCLPIVSPYVA